MKFNPDLIPVPVADAAAAEDSSPGEAWEPPPLEAGSVTAQVVASVWRGERCVIVNSPPGGGKSRLLTHAAVWLALKAGLSVCVAAFTTAQQDALLARLAEIAPAGSVSKRTAHGPGHITVSTIAAAAYDAAKGDREFDVILVDEAYQLTVTDVMNAASGAEQIVLVGDPGQIGPVVTATTTAWDGMAVPPHTPSPTAFAKDAHLNPLILNLPDTWRFGPETVELLVPLYPFRFGTMASPPLIFDALGDVLPEIGQAAVATMGDLADLAVAHLGVALSTQPWGRRSTVASDVAVVVSRAAHERELLSMFGGMGHTDITVGTADKLQGGQWPVVIALDPIAGEETFGGHQTSMGRFVVMTSRHSARLTWAHSPAATARLADEVGGLPTHVRRFLEAKPAFPSTLRSHTP
jgi:hypothetical protein